MNEASKKKPAKPIARARTPTAWIVIAPLDYGWTHSPLCSPLLMRRNDVPQNYQKRQKCRSTIFLSGPPLEQGGHLISPRIDDLLIYFEKKTAPELKQWK
jgi:hypothetical protein